MRTARSGTPCSQSITPHLDDNSCGVIVLSKVILVISHDSVTALQRHLAEAMGVEVHWEKSGLGDRLPMGLRSQYLVKVASLLGHQCAFLIRTGGDEVSAETIAKHLAVVRGKWSDAIVMVADRITPHVRRRLIAERIPFIIPGTQVSLPFLGMLLHERFPVPKSAAVEALRPAAQATLLWWIHHGFAKADTARTLAPLLGYTPMSLSRVFDDLEHLAQRLPALSVERIGRERKARWQGGARKLWQTAQPLMQDPVVRREIVRFASKTIGCPAGLTGMSAISDVTAPDLSTIAVERSAWIAYRKKHRPAPALRGEPGTVMVEVWRYAPDLHRERLDQQVASADPLSITLSMAGQSSSADERVEAALAQVIAEYPWRW